MVIGSKLIAGAEDDRPWARHAASQVYTAFCASPWASAARTRTVSRRSGAIALADIADDCLVDNDVFASEFVIRAYRAGLTIIEIPVRVVEKRPPSINLLKRVPQRAQEPRQAELGDPYRHRASEPAHAPWSLASAPPSRR